MIVTIDGPAGAGKSSVARALAQRLGFAFLDTGAMYRTVALAALRQELSWDDPQALAALARASNIEVREDGTFLEGQDVSQEIRSHAVTSATHYAANNPAVRVHLVELQRQVAGRLDIVTEGRDQGTIVFPQAECKIFLDASPEERARRRQADLAARGEKLSLEEVLADQNRRDESDASREVGPLVAAVDAVHFSTDGLAAEEVVDRLEVLVRARMPQPTN
ncbi:MAG TPA: (d)CMP kinase [Pirellulales bacterium]|jgi:cytidylate kinase